MFVSPCNARFSPATERFGEERQEIVKKMKIVLWVLRNRRARKLVVSGLKSRRVRALVWTVAKRRFGL